MGLFSVTCQLYFFFFLFGNKVNGQNIALRVNMANVQQKSYFSSFFFFLTFKNVTGLKVRV